MNPKPVLAIGSIALDTLVMPSGRRWEVLGGSATYFALAAALYTKVHLVGIVGDDFPEEDTRLFAERGIGTDDLQRVPGKTFRWGGRYSADLADRNMAFAHPRGPLSLFGRHPHPRQDRRSAPGLGSLSGRRRFSGVVN